MTGLLICAAGLAMMGCGLAGISGAKRYARDGLPIAIAAIALIAVALWLAYAAGAQL